MRDFLGGVLLGVMLFLCPGCEPPKSGGFDGPQIDKFVGRLVKDGKPVSFEPAEKVTLQLMFLKRNRSFGVPIKPDGSFDIGWMPIGKYGAVVERREPGNPRPTVFTLPKEFQIEAGKTEYEIELGPNWKS
jgi:hypothetical protein